MRAAADAGLLPRPVARHSGQRLLVSARGVTRGDGPRGLAAGRDMVIKPLLHAVAARATAKRLFVSRVVAFDGNHRLVGGTIWRLELFELAQPVEECLGLRLGVRAVKAVCKALRLHTCNGLAQRRLWLRKPLLPRECGLRCRVVVLTG